MARHHFNTDILKSTYNPLMTSADSRLDSELNDPSRWMDLDSCEITTKCSILDSRNKYYYSSQERKAEPPNAPLPRPPVSALTKSFETKAQRNHTSHMLDIIF